MNRRGVIAVGVLVLWVLGLALFARREFFRPPAQQLAEAALRVAPGVVFYQVLRDGQQIGFASSSIDTTDRGFMVTDQLVTDLPRDGGMRRVSTSTQVQLTRGLRVTEFTLTADSGARVHTAAGQVDADSVLSVVARSGSSPADSQRVQLDEPVLLAPLVPLATILLDEPKVGRRYAFSVLDPATRRPRPLSVAIRAESLFVVSDSAQFDSTRGRWTTALDDTIRAWQLVLDGADEIRLWADDQGRLIQASQPGGLLLRRTAYEIAFENWRLDAAGRPAGSGTLANVREQSIIADGVPLDRPPLAELRLLVRGTLPPSLRLESGRQRRSGDTLVLSVDSPRLLSAEYVPGSRPIRQRFSSETSPAPQLQSGHPAVQLQVSRIVGGERSPHAIAARLARWVHDSVSPRASVDPPNALATLRARAGDVDDQAQLFAALARAAGLPTRLASGLLYVDGRFYYHVWPEVYLASWVAVDPVLGQFPADAAHLRITTASRRQHAELARLVGSLDLEVVSTR